MKAYGVLTRVTVFGNIVLDYPVLGHLLEVGSQAGGSLLWKSCAVLVVFPSRTPSARSERSVTKASQQMAESSVFSSVLSQIRGILWWYVGRSQQTRHVSIVSGCCLFLSAEQGWVSTRRQRNAGRKIRAGPLSSRSYGGLKGITESVFYPLLWPVRKAQVGTSRGEWEISE